MTFFINNKGLYVIIFTCVCNIHDDDFFLCTLLRHKDISPQSQSVILKNSFDDPKLAAELHQTLADFEADLAGKRGKNISYTE